VKKYFLPPWGDSAVVLLLPKTTTALLSFYIWARYLYSAFNIVWLFSTANRKNVMVWASSCLLMHLFHIQSSWNRCTL